MTTIFINSLKVDLKLFKTQETILPKIGGKNTVLVINVFFVLFLFLLTDLM